MKKNKKILFASLLALIFAIIFIWGLSYYIKSSTAELVYHKLGEVTPVNTIIVLGASVHSDGQLSPILQDRVDTALKLYRNGKGKNFLLSGDHREDTYDEVNAMRNYLIEKNVPEEDIFTDPAGIDTYDSMFRSSKIYNVSNAVVVTQAFHLPRALYIAKHLGLNYVGFPAFSAQYKTEPNLLRREKLANIKAIYELGVHHLPNTMGKKTPIPTSSDSP
ncbi:MAG: ElyC/SanA/YdcF family protein [Gillisia sp.]